MKTIGLLGGIGPQATMDLEVRIHSASQKLITPSANAGYPPLVVWYHRSAPFVMTDVHTPVFPLRINPALADGARWLGQVADFLILGSNGAHAVQSQIEEVAGKPVLSMIDIVLKEVQRRGWSRIGVVTFGDRQAHIYSEPLRELGLSTEIINADLQVKVNDAVPKLMAGTATEESTADVRSAVNLLRSHGTDGIILGCTELPLLLGDSVNEPDLLNPSELLAEAAVRHAM